MARAQPAGPLEQAKRAFDTQQYTEAARLFETARKLDPACEISFYLGLAQYRLNQRDDAVIAFQEAVQCDPKLTDAYIALGEAYAERGNLGKAVVAYERGLSLDPENASALGAAAALYTKEKLREKAATLLERLVKKEPANARAHADLGALYFNLGNQEGAEKEFRISLKLDPRSAAALLGQGNLLLRKGEEEQAIQKLREVVSMVPKAFEPRFVLGSAYNRLGQFAAAASELETAVKLGGTEPEIYYNLARAYGGLGRSEERRVALARFAEISLQEKLGKEGQRNAVNLVERAKTLVDSGELAGALTQIEQARKLRPHDDTILFRLASLAYDLAHYDQARETIREAIALAPSEWVYHLLLGLIECRSGKLTAARASLDVVVRLNPLAAEAHNALGEVALQEGDRDTARSSFRKASELHPDNIAFRLNLQAVEKDIGKE